uniref:DUF3619 family protein n=1 Tax=Polynucleobacter sp. TaxID=2029855 RepID=UPI00404873FC
MTPIQDHSLSLSEMDRFGNIAISHLNETSTPLTAAIQNRLYAARIKALSMQKTVSVFAHQTKIAMSSGNWLSKSPLFHGSAGWILPFIFLGLGLVGVAQWQQDSRINDIAEVDIALLTDDIPPDAYADAGFMIFLKNGPLADIDQENTESKTSDNSS